MLINYYTWRWTYEDEIDSEGSSLQHGGSHNQGWTKTNKDQDFEAQNLETKKSPRTKKGKKS